MINFYSYLKENYTNSVLTSIKYKCGINPNYKELDDKIIAYIHNKFMLIDDRLCNNNYETILNLTKDETRFLRRFFLLNNRKLDNSPVFKTENTATSVRYQTGLRILSVKLLENSLFENIERIIRLHQLSLPLNNSLDLSSYPKIKEHLGDRLTLAQFLRKSTSWIANQSGSEDEINDLSRKLEIRNIFFSENWGKVQFSWLLTDKSMVQKLADIKIKTPADLAIKNKNEFYSTVGFTHLQVEIFDELMRRMNFRFFDEQFTDSENDIDYEALSEDLRNCSVSYNTCWECDIRNEYLKDSNSLISCNACGSLYYKGKKINQESVQKQRVKKPKKTFPSMRIIIVES